MAKVKTISTKRLERRLNQTKERWSLCAAERLYFFNLQNARTLALRLSRGSDQSVGIRFTSASVTSKMMLPATDPRWTD